MVQLCFVLDLRSLVPPLLRDIKQSLLQLANFYAISSSSSSHARKSVTLGDKIGLCYVFKNRLSSSDELAVAYNPVGNFNLRDFHHAVNNLPYDAFLADIDSISDLMISNVLSERVLYSWQGKDIERKVIVITSTLPEDIDSIVQKSLMDAADKCVSVDFAVFQQKSIHLTDTRENINNFRRCISHLDNCSVQTYIPDFRVFHSLVKRWLLILKDDMEEPLLARLIFKDNLFDSVNHIFCNLFAPVNPITNIFTQCRTCRCHGIPLGDAEKNFSRLSCSVTGCNLETCDVMENSVQLGEKNILFLPSFYNSLKPLQISLPINITVTERINLTSLDEGLIIGASFVVIPSSYHPIETTSDDGDQSDLNVQLFRGLSSFLHSMNQGLICSSNCDLETMAEAPYHCYYILQPSDTGPMLMRRLAGAEEVLRVPDNQLVDSSINKEIESSVQACLLKIDLTDYDPLLHERGFHQKLNVLVKESLQFWSVFSKSEGAFSELSASQQPSSEVMGKAEPATGVIVNEETLALDITDHDDKTMACITEEWKQLVVSEDPKLYSPSSMPKAKLGQSSVSPRDGNRKLDRETSRILERLEVPRPLKAKTTSPGSNESCMKNTSVPIKKPLVPFQPTQGTEQVLVGSQLMKPNFQRQKRKHK
ncbi:hypothetical protein AAZX31_08G006200 [Glycine max]|uniref:Uncharacterized protein n=2 Tax=Glycine subgen. Soja TaxID=1462606 RepID=I1KP12_SOYBN|nr:uncharacterized protein LOC100794173 isoform X1 [Glycine max]XP_028242491.1 uncharacterized protein LOC114420963 [Glycine soja]XP_040873801.1 uncharacterized protein LOC100794173 isoform X1 [Glycine max]KAH1048942.1 hypothetical protein GYH30_019831 [Glycine max]KAH1235503.1 hypothetical protein GmHk_08G020975 [Glycine max]KHN16902.1 hypothetical protein glysoja_002999 [Glycine soja]KRH41031.1 hypothetical protein GLYMA_08G006100v4 [Glycine max]RZB94579.1 hypothetical protein D0Y65_019226|eukprot:XP_014634101.1 uncharacterized protein LOC100794173 [Glycine max]